MAKILLIEDDALLVRMYQNKLQMDGYEVMVAGDGEEGLARIKEMMPDLILLDIMMPKMNGFEVLEQMKKDETIKTIPVVLLTNLGGSDEDVEKGLELGAVAYLIKSNVVPADVVAKIKEVLAATGANGLPKAVPIEKQETESSDL